MNYQFGSIVPCRLGQDILPGSSWWLVRILTAEINHLNSMAGAGGWRRLRRSFEADLALISSTVPTVCYYYRRATAIRTRELSHPKVRKS